MDDERVVSRAGMHVVRGCLIVSIQTELYDEVAHQIQVEVLDKVHESAIKGVVFDVSMVEVMDSYIARIFADTARMTSILGAQTVLVGIRPAVAIALTDLDLGLTDIRTALSLEHALQLLEPLACPEKIAQTGTNHGATPHDISDSEERRY